jgi:hypothetical protein
MDDSISYLYALQQKKCIWCGREMLAPGSAMSKNDPLAPTIDHVVPKAAGGGGGVNKRAACLECNQMRNTFNRAAYERQRQDQDKSIRRLKGILVSQDKEIKRLSAELLNRFIDPWWRRLGRYLWTNLCLKYYGKPQPEEL